MANTSDLKITDKAVVRELTVGNVSKTEEKTLESFFEKFSKDAVFDTGILPLDGTGVLAIRKGLGHTQIVFQFKPGMYLNIWGKHERDKNAKTINVAQPYRIVIIDTKTEGQSEKLIGARHFYSPVPIQSGDQMLYHCNVPNLNCKGYGGTSVGWMCLYPREDYAKYSFDHRIRKLLEKSSGAEAFNDINMSGTDGARFYKAHKKPQFLWDPDAWEAKSKKEGWEWTIDLNLWIPIKVKGVDSQDSHDDNGVPLTIEMAMLGGYHAYYSDALIPKPVNAYARSDLKDPGPEKILNSANQAFLNSAKKGVENPPQLQGMQVKKLLGQSSESQSEPPQNQQPKNQQQNNPPVVEEPAFGATSFALSAPINPIVGYCPDCSNAIHQEDTFKTIANKKVCEDCANSFYGTCAECKEEMHFANLQAFNNQSYCKKCHVIYPCPNCGKQYFNDPAPLIGVVGCIECKEYDHCQSCQGKFLKEEIIQVQARNIETKQMAVYPLCMDCMGASVICGCGYLRDQGATAPMGDFGTFACEPCIDFKDDGMPFFNGQFLPDPDAPEEPAQEQEQEVAIQTTKPEPSVTAVSV